MAIQNINIGSAPNDNTGDNLRSAFDKVNINFTEVINKDFTTYPDIPLPLQDSDELLVNRGGTLYKVDKSELGGGGNLVYYKNHWYNRTRTQGTGVVEFVDGFLLFPAGTLQADDRIILRTQVGDMDDSTTTFQTNFYLNQNVQVTRGGQAQIGGSSNNRRIAGFSREFRVLDESTILGMNAGAQSFTDFYSVGINATYQPQNGILPNLFTEDIYLNVFVNCPNTRNYNLIFTEVYVYRNS